MLSALNVSQLPTLCIIAEHLASCDEDYIYFDFEPEEFLIPIEWLIISLFLGTYPTLLKDHIKYSYINLIQFLCFAVK